MATISTAQSPTLQASQYHHFIPRFLLTNYAVFKNPQGGTASGVPIRNRKGKLSKPSMLNLVNLEHGGKLEQHGLARSFGIVDMYREFDNTIPDQHDLEKKLSKLENVAAEIIAKVKATYEAGKPEVQLTRGEKDELRRFVFIMMYRSHTFYGRFNKSKDDYDAEDREKMLEYMREKKFEKPIDVWFSNIRAFLEIRLGFDFERWKAELDAQAYPMDALWFFKNLQMSFVAFCSPLDKMDEFLLTQNAYSVFEGPNNGFRWTDFHTFAPVSPTLMIVMRSFGMPSGIKEEENLRRLRRDMLLANHLDPSQSSCLEDLPIEKVRNNYSMMVDGSVQAVPTKMSPDKHIFYFRYFSLSKTHVQKINTIFLEEADTTLAIAYKSSSGLLRALEAYFGDETSGMRTVYDLPDISTDQSFIRSDPLGPKGKDFEAYLKILESVAKNLGSVKKANYTIKPLSAVDVSSSDKFKILRRYETLGGRIENWDYDMDQASRILELVTKTDSLMNKQNEVFKSEVQKKRAALICTLPSQRVYLFLKSLSVLTKLDLKTMEPHKSSEDGELSLADPEDAIVDARVLFKEGVYRRIMYRVATLNQFLVLHPDFGLVREIDLDENGYRRIMEEKSIMFDKPGSIRDCGIEIIERAAASHFSMAKSIRSSQMLGDEGKLLLGVL